MTEVPFQDGAATAPLVYFAHPIDRRTWSAAPPPQTATVAVGSDGHLFRQVPYCVQAAQRAGLAVYDPQTAFPPAPEGMRARADGRVVCEINQLAQARAAGTLVLLPTGTPSIGTPIEMAWARDHGQPYAIVTDDPTLTLFSAFDHVYVHAEHAARDLADQIRSAARRQMDRLVVRQPLPVRLEPGAAAPLRGYADDAGFDLTVLEDTVIPARDEYAHGGFVDVRCGVSVEFPPGVWGLVTGRSSTIRKRGILVVNGIIDTGFRGELFAACQNMRDEPAVLVAGERVAQVILLPNLSAGYDPMVVSELSSSERGTQGFGSSGGFADPSATVTDLDVL